MDFPLQITVIRSAAKYCLSADGQEFDVKFIRRGILLICDFQNFVARSMAVATEWHIFALPHSGISLIIFLALECSYASRSEIGDSQTV